MYNEEKTKREDINNKLSQTERDISDLNEDKIAVSVIIPIYNTERYLKDCLKSICNQTLENIEIICINDGSTDNSYEILKEVAKTDDRIKIFNTPNKRQGHARNLGLKIARGEYISFVDSDDWIEKDTYEIAYNKCKEDDLDLVFFNLINYIQSTGAHIKTDLYNHRCLVDANITEDVIFKHSDIKDLLFKIPVCPVSKLYRRTFLLENELFYPTEIYFEDNEYFYKTFLKCERAAYLNKHFYFRRRHDTSVTNNLNTNTFDIVEAANHILDLFLLDDNLNDYRKSVINHAFSMVYEWFNKVQLEYKEAFYNVMRNNFKAFKEYHKLFDDCLNPIDKIRYDLIETNSDYLNFLIKEKMETLSYDVYDGLNFYEKDSYEYIDYNKSEDKKDYLVSVIIPIFNNETFIHRTLMSLENQTLGIENIEVLMVNDASSDNTSEIIEEYAQKSDNFKVIHIREGTGSPGIPRNIGMIESHADYVLFLDHDDFLEIDAIEKLYNQISSEKSDVVFGTYISIINDKINKITYPNEKHGYFNSIDDNERIISFPPPSIWTKLLRKQFILDNDILFPHILGEDAIFMSKVLVNANGINYLWDDVICYHDLSSYSKTNNVTVDYLVEGFVSERYMYDYYKSLGKINYYDIRGEGIVDFYLTQINNSSLNDNQMERIYRLLHEFVHINKGFNSRPNKAENKILYDIVLQDDMDALIRFKNIQLKSRTINTADKKELKRLNNENRNLINETKTLTEENKNLTTFKNNVLNSKSWKITKPLRKLFNLFK